MRSIDHSEVMETGAAVAEVFKDLLRRIIRRMNAAEGCRMIIGICGGTGSGKTTIARAIVEAVGA